MIVLRSYQDEFSLSGFSFNSFVKHEVLNVVNQSD